MIWENTRASIANWFGNMPPFLEKHATQKRGNGILISPANLLCEVSTNYTPICVVISADGLVLLIDYKFWGANTSQRKVSLMVEFQKVPTANVPSPGWVADHPAERSNPRNNFERSSWAPLRSTWGLHVFVTSVPWHMARGKRWSIFGEPLTKEQVYQRPWLRQWAQWWAKAGDPLRPLLPCFSDLRNDPEIGGLWPTAVSPNSARYATPHPWDSLFLLIYISAYTYLIKH